jgi:hypothetical protein
MIISSEPIHDWCILYSLFTFRPFVKERRPPVALRLVIGVQRQPEPKCSYLQSNGWLHDCEYLLLPSINRSDTRLSITIPKLSFQVESLLSPIYNVVVVVVVSGKWLLQTLCRLSKRRLGVRYLLRFQSAVVVLPGISVSSCKTKTKLRSLDVPHNRFAAPTMISALIVSF